MDTQASGVLREMVETEKRSQQKWLESRRADGFKDHEDDSDEDDMASYESMLKRMPQQTRVSLRTLQMRKGGLTRKIGSWADKERDPPRTPSQDVQMIRSKMPPLVRPPKTELEGYNTHTHIPGYTGFFPGRQCKEYLLLKRAEPEMGAMLNDLSLRYKTKLAPPHLETLKTTNNVKDHFAGKLRDPDLADWSNHRIKSENTEYVRRAIKLHVNIKASGH
eukprot:TRINITY_DN14662_c0_g1_i1.p1 TRINITY_DN14662_c0_g1~~TRINITY_DN14662_c0_g1_i1.p1  ORF type:complete len:220 (-),score=40.72 TRINITY_DN14662_c0_g1_i1:391-1050(-)